MTCSTWVAPVLTVALLAMLLFPATARAADTWTTVAPGVEHLHRTTADPQDYHVMLIDLSRAEIWLRATGPGENGQTTSSFAAAVGATVAINGDLWDADNWNAYEPLGLAVGDGWKWRDDTDVWSHLACDVNKRCEYDPWGSFVASNVRWHNAIGGMQDLLVIGGVPQSYSGAFYTARNPRTATGVSADGNTLVLLVADGRRPGALGMTFADLSAVMVEFGAHNAMNNDGGGSSTLVISGAVQNVPSDGYERTVANHLGIMIADHTDAACLGVENSRQCVDNTQMRTCTGGLDRGVGDCGFYGLTCENDGLFAFCVAPQCVNGGQNSLCLDETRIGICEDGVYREGDCAGFGLPCVEGFGTAWCWADFRQATPVASSLDASAGGELTVTLGEQPTVWFELENTGLVTWIPGVTQLAPIPRDVGSSLAGSDWIAAHRVASVTAEVPPGQVGRFTFTLAPAALGTHTLALGLLDEGVTWFADRPGGGGPEDGALSVTIHVVDEGNTGGDGGVSGDGGGTGDSDAQTTGDSTPKSGASGCSCLTGGRGAEPVPAPGSGLLWVLFWGVLVAGIRRRRKSRGARA